MTNYANGEQPKAGDLVHCVSAKGHAARPDIPVRIGGVYKVDEAHAKIIQFEGVRSGFGGSSWWMPSNFALIARDGEPVKYLPGDVVELTQDDSDFELAGQRFVVREHDTENASIFTPQGYVKYMPGLSLRAHNVRLVARPLKAEETDARPPVGVPLTAETVELLRAGDLVRCDGWSGEFYTTGKVYEVELDDGRPTLRFNDGELDHNLIETVRMRPFTFIGRPDADGWITKEDSKAAEPVKFEPPVRVTVFDAGEGDRVRVTVEGEVRRANGSGLVIGEPDTTESVRIGIDANVIECETVSTAIRVGDKVLVPVYAGSSISERGEVRYVEGDTALVRMENGGFRVTDLPHLERAP